MMLLILENYFILDTLILMGSLAHKKQRFIANCKNYLYVNTFDLLKITLVIIISEFFQHFPNLEKICTNCLNVLGGFKNYIDQVHFVFNRFPSARACFCNRYWGIYCNLGPSRPVQPADIEGHSQATQTQICPCSL